MLNQGAKRVKYQFLIIIVLIHKLVIPEDLLIKAVVLNVHSKNSEPDPLLKLCVGHFSVNYMYIQAHELIDPSLPTLF